METGLILDEQNIQRTVETDAAKYTRQFGETIEEASEIFNKSYKGHAEWSMYDTVNLGRYLESWLQYKEVFQEDVATRDTLGDYLKVGMGLAAVQYVTLPANFLASVQPLPDESGQIYFRELVATMNRGNLMKGDIIGSQQGKLSTDLDGYYSEELNSVTPLVATTDLYPVTLSAPLRPRLMKFTVSITNGGVTKTYTGMDDGEGVIFGSWPSPAGKSAGEVTSYTNGTINLNVDTSAGDTGSIVIVYHQNLAQADEIPGFMYRLVSKTVRVNYFLLQTQYSSLAEYSVRRRFGEAMADDIVTSAVTQINSAVLSSMIRKLRAAALSTGTVNWDGAAPPGVPTSLHRQTFGDAIEGALQLIDAKTSRSALSFIIAGSSCRKVLATLGVELVRKPLPGPYLAGFFQNVPVFYAPQTLIPNNEAIIGYRGATWFEAPIVYAPWLPIAVVKGQGSNVFNKVNGICHGAAIETLVPGFTARIQIDNM